MKFYVRPLDCEEVGYFSKRYDNELFAEYCVDWEAGHHKPQIRLHNSISYFNITNFAQFENIQFTAEDSLANITNKTYSQHFDHAPLVKCAFEEEPTEYLANATVEAWKERLLRIDFECSTGYNHSVDLPPYEEEVGCEADDFSYQSVRSCTGEPYHEHFFDKHVLDMGKFTALDSTQAQFPLHPTSYPERHNVLFNLYSFDPIHSKRVHSPTLRLINCDFKYFFNMQALIQIETNNLVEMGIAYNADGTELISATERVEDRFIAHVGVDRGARIEIIDSSFKHSRFCKGMIAYHEFEYIGYGDYPNFVHVAANYAGLIPTYADSRKEPFVKIGGSTFENLAYHQVVTALSNLNANPV